MWLLEEEFDGPDGVRRARRGLVARVRLDPYADGVVLPHEGTFSGPKEARLRLLRATGVKPSPIFLLHHGEAPAQILNLAKINKYHVQMVGHLADRLAKKQEGDGTLLDHSLILYGSNMGNSNQHVHYDVPHVLVGGAGGKLKGGRHLAYPSKTVPTGNLLLSVLDRFDIHQDSIGDSTGRLEDL